METGERLKGNEPGINTFPHQDGCELGKRLKKGPVYEVMRLKALGPKEICDCQEKQKIRLELIYIYI